MRLGTLRTDDHTVAVRVDQDEAVQIEGASDVGVLLADPQWRTAAERAAGRRFDLSALEPTAWAPVIPRPSKIICIGLNYRQHIMEMGRELPSHPTMFAKYPEALIGAFDDIVLPRLSEQVDWEGELAVIVGRTVRDASAADAADAIAGYTVINDVTVRDFQYRTTQWLQGKTFEATAPFGPHVVTADAWEAGSQLSTLVADEVVQDASTADLVFGPADLVAYVSRIVTLQPGDVIATGTPGGVGHARKPPRYLTAGDVLRTRIDGLGEQRNRVTTRD